eukprot:CAMPEP_0170447662 /NCGR_PEP_ID=MMETSP0117_2-20130122/50286_1 /TAXON_ID=400756 /ORGANISM="Durinskia baltica, Strain CSIRO CS-38" /LENGTH=72 /DNA_ID=CAMNT_0010708763 /DNA_START=277 /DNA_END=491 /DNA_ORIENTATION=+
MREPTIEAASRGKMRFLYMDEAWTHSCMVATCRQIAMRGLVQPTVGAGQPLKLGLAARRTLYMNEVWTQSCT